MKHKSQRGTTLVELLLAVAVIGMIAPLLSTTIFQLTTITEKSQSRSQLLQAAGNAGFWLSGDVQRATATDLADGAPAVNTVTLTWNEGSQARNAVYALSGTELVRTLGAETRTVARNVSGVSFSRSDDIVTMDVQLVSSDRWLTGIQKRYQAALRYTG